MDHLPLSDIPMLVSTINFLLRDEIFENLDQICYCYGVEREEMDRPRYPSAFRPLSAWNLIPASICSRMVFPLVYPGWKAALSQNVHPPVPSVPSLLGQVKPPSSVSR